ncbi:MAG: hypothetical protein KH828_11275 [Clostridiales bacterium]|nr:hypothetical protein [Clostridiales bacterium]
MRIGQKVSAFALYLRKSDSAVSLVTVGGREYYVYRYEGELNDIPNAVVLISYPKRPLEIRRNYFFVRAKVSLLWINTSSVLSRKFSETG